MSAGPVVGQPRRWLRAEGLLTLVASIVLYATADSSWLLFGVLFLAPDLSLLGYLAGPKTGAMIYNAVHSYVGPLGVAVVLLLMDASAALSLIWFAHIGMDRALGYGLKFPSAFQDTHLGRIGK